MQEFCQSHFYRRIRIQEGRPFQFPVLQSPFDQSSQSASSAKTAVTRVSANSCSSKGRSKTRSLPAQSYRENPSTAVFVCQHHLFFIGPGGYHIFHELIKGFIGWQEFPDQSTQKTIVIFSCVGRLSLVLTVHIPGFQFSIDSFNQFFLIAGYQPFLLRI